MYVDGDDDAFTILARRMSGKLNLLSHKFYVKGTEPDDICQEGLMILSNACHQYKPEKGSFATFASFVMRRRLITLVMASQRKRNAINQEAVSLDAELYSDSDEEIASFATIIPMDEMTPEERAIREEEHRKAKRLLFSSLTPKERGVLRRYLKGASYAQSARQAGVTTKIVDNALVRVRNKARDMVRKGEIL